MSFCRFYFVSLFLCLVTPVANAQERPQIYWQRSLEDALILSKAQNRPLLVAINLDGESASDRIVVERYRDPRFVAWTRRFVCVIGHPFRHNLRDYDEKGRRIPCPRLGEVTCGEHVALEPAIFDKYLGGDRVSPRHALIQLDGTKTFDLYYLFDLRDLDRALEENAPKAPAPTEFAAIGAADWPAQAAARDVRQRDAFESALASLPAGSDVRPALRAIATGGNSGSADALRVVLAREDWREGWMEALGEAATAIGGGEALAAGARDRLATAGSFPGAPGLGEDRRYLVLLGALDGKNPNSRMTIIARFVLDNAADRKAARAALARTLSAEQIAAMESALRDEGGPYGPFADLARAQATPLATVPSAFTDALPPMEEIQKELEAADEALGKKPDDVAAMERLGLASLQMARVKMEKAMKGSEFLLEDASQWLRRAAQAKPGNFSIGVARARTAYFRGQFEEEESLGFQLAQSAHSQDERAEAFRWAGDGAARLLASRAAGEPAMLARGIRRGIYALSQVCVTNEAAEIDWTSLASFFALLGCAREELATLQAGATKLSESAPLREALNGALWRAGRIDLAPHKAEWLAARNPKSAPCAFYAGYAWMLAAEDARRRERSEDAIGAYRHAESQLRRAADLNPSERSRMAHFLGMCALGRGFAELIDGKQPLAADALIEGISLASSAADARDGLDREGVDLLDGALEWREGRASPIDAAALADRFEKNGLGVRWLLALSDTTLREALRADGRSPSGHQAPTEEGDGYMEASIAAARRALAVEAGEASRHTLAQSLAVHGERMLVRGRLEAASPLFAEAGKLLEEPAPADARRETLEAFAHKLRARLGPARPVFRPGR